MKLEHIYRLLDEISPFETQESWDNSGVNIGSMDDDVKSIVVSLDIDEQLLDSIEPNTLLITHHPIIFSSLKSLDYAKYPANLLQKMVQKNISNIVMHTNFDKSDLNAYVATEILGLEIAKQDDYVIYFDVHYDFDKLLEHTQSVFSLKRLKYVKCHESIRRLALTTGAGASMLGDIEADCYLTGDIKYHDAMAARSMNISLIDIGHYESECFFSTILANHLKNLGLEVIISHSQNPFSYKSLKGDQ